MHVLVVDDEKPMLSLFGELLEEEGHHVTLASSAEEALQLLQTCPAPELIFVDYSMPKMSGTDFLITLKAKSPTLIAKTKIIGFSSFAQDAPLLGEFATLVTRVIEKPLGLDELVEVIHQFAS